jgi:hypothetical protein
VAVRTPNSDYYAGRLNAEWRAIRTASCDKAREAHQAMADYYADRLIQSLDAVQPRRQS